MLQGIEAVTTQALGLALDAASLRQQVIAANIANANTIGYLPQHLSFGGQMEQVQAEIRDAGSLSAGSLTALRPTLALSLDSQGLPAKVRLDEEMAAMAQNTVQYQALIKGLNRHFSILATAASDGKR
ncbi:flagellar basal body rod protein FlgB [Herbaspirillum autotrophicum]|uniref:flagellar basal body rod protein FlgB n=1 Tax=Herbaspirillum autotrophicum TaxID=180195 RepID=UPI00067DF0DF|nr:flagellar basal body rod protein FlgB [Herbaspirillum autotrophicum]